MCEPKHQARTWGFRFSFTDAIAIGVFLAAAGGLWHLGSPLWWLLLIAAAHFFLFCNVFRIVRRREFIWAGVFVANVGAWAWFDHLTWIGILACQLPITVTLIIADTRGAEYHGIYADKLNPRLNEYLEGHLP